VKQRATATLVIALALVLGLGLYVARYMAHGADWAMFAANAALYDNARLTVGTLIDRNGTVLAGFDDDGNRRFAESESVRRATLHVTGDKLGNIGTGALKAFDARLAGYNAVTGAYSRVGRGATVALTIDAELSAVALKALDGRRGAVLVMNYETGELLCAVSSPTFDPENPPTITDGDTRYDGAYLNRGLSSTFTPGSVFKLITSAAAIENIPDIRTRTFTCTGSQTVGGERITCPEKHGELTFKDALAVSCNVAFAELSLELGADTLARYADRAGLLERLSLDGILSAAGRFDEAEADSAELAWSGIGQANDLASPLAMLRYVSAIANGGEAAEPHLLLKTGLSSVLPREKTRLLNEKTASELAELMANNVTAHYGADNFAGLELHAKTGTAEVGVGKPPHAWFVGFIRNEGHPLAFAVIVENGGSGRLAAGGVANSVLKAAIDN
jgi:peptidoglycan glycosyltransferase